MANIVLISLFLAVSYSMATAASYKEMMGDSLCEYKNTPEDCEQLGECLKENRYTVKKACDEEEVAAANIKFEDWPKIYNCTWRKSGQLKEDNTCDKDKQMAALAKIEFQNDKTKADFIAAGEQCNEENEFDCFAAQFCASFKFLEICYPNAKIPDEYKTDT